MVKNIGSRAMINVTKLLLISFCSFISTVHALDKGTVDKNFGNTAEPGTHLFSYTNVCDTQLDTGQWDWTYTIGDLITKNNFNYISFDLYKNDNYTANPDLSSIVKIPSSGGSGVSFICEQISRSSKLAIDSSDSLYVINEYSENKIQENGNPIQARGLKVIKYDSNGQLINETGKTWPYKIDSTPGYSYEQTATFTQNDELIIVAPVIYAGLYMQPFSFKYDPTNDSLSLDGFDYQVENKTLSFGVGTSIDKQSGRWFQNISTHQIDTGLRQDIYTAYIRKIDSSNNIATNFSNLGNLLVTPENSSFDLSASTMLNSGDLIASGYSYQLDTPYEQKTTIVKLSPFGIMDSSFGEGGYLNIPIQNISAPSEDEYSTLYSRHKLISTTSGLNILSTIYNQEIRNDTFSVYHNSKQLLVFDNSGKIDDSLTQLLKQSLNLEFFTVSDMKQDDFGALIFAGYCKNSQGWLGCIKRINWDNKTATAQTSQSGSGSISLLLIFALIFVRRIKE